MMLTVIPKIGSSFLEPTTFELKGDHGIVNYSLPKEIIDLIRNPPKILKDGKSYDVPDWVNTANIYITLKKEDE